MNTMVSRAAISCVAFTLASSCTSLAAAHEKDLRTQTDATGETEISFCSRPSPDSFGFPGHAFVAFSERPPGKPRVFRAVGHTIGPSTSTPSTVFTYFGGAAVSGQQAEERYTHMKQACLTVKVDRAVYVQALAAARPTLSMVGVPDALAASAERYSLNANDCIDFALKVAQPIRAKGLIVPTRTPTDLPSTYVRKLIDANI